MLIMNNTNINYNGVCKNADGAEIAHMNASYNGDSNIYFSLNITSDRTNSVIDTDFAAFKAKVLESIESVEEDSAE